MTEKKHIVLAKLALFISALTWGSTFVIIKNSTDSLDPNFIMAMRFTIALAILIIVNLKHLKELTASHFKRGFLMGITLWGSYGFQTVALALDATPGKCAFLISVYCVIVPFLYWLVSKKRPDKFHIIAAVLCVLGIGLVSYNGGLAMNIGDALTLLSGLSCAVNIVLISIMCKGEGGLLLTMLQIGYVALFSWLVVIFTGGFPQGFDAPAMLGTAYLGVCATAMCIAFQTYGLKHTNPTSASIIFSLEAVFGVIFSIIFYHEKVTLRMGIGFAVIFFAVILSETKLSFLIKPKNKKFATEEQI